MAVSAVTMKDGTMKADSKGIKRLPRVTLSGRIAEEIREAVLSGAFPLGSQLNEMDLAEKFGVSRGPVREAMQRLIQEGLLHSEPHRGVFVPELTDTDLSDVYYVREAIEGAAVQRIMARQDRKDIHLALMKIAKQMEKTVTQGSWLQVADIDLAFHRELVEAAGSFRLSRMYATVQAETKLCMHMLMGGYRSSKALVEEHELLANLIAGDDVAATLRELSRHFGDPIRILRKANAVRQGSEAA
jgi:DNA-binding GntR family transcriptional regulator